MKKNLHDFILRLKLFACRQLRPISLDLEQAVPLNIQKSPEYLLWLNDNLVKFTDEFFAESRLNDSYFVKKMCELFNTSRFKTLIKKWTVDYYYALFKIFYDYAGAASKQRLILEDNPLNRFGAKKYSLQFGVKFVIDWHRPAGSVKKFFSLALLISYIIFMSLRSGIKLSGRKKQFKVMREALWGFYNTGGYFFHDDFLIDGKKLKKDDLLLFSRVAIKWCDTRLKAYHDAKKSNYAHFYLPSLPIGITQFLFRVIPEYIFGGVIALGREFRSSNFSLLKNIYWYFVFYGLAYEKVFSNFKIISELGHNYFAPNHIAESIICQNYGVKYYLMHWSDNSVDMNKYISSFLGCDNYLAWGKAHIRGVEGEENIILTGYPFKVFVQRVIRNRAKVLSEMNIAAHGKIITFFDESFGNLVLMTENQYLEFWRTILKVAEAEQGHTVVIKPKEISRYKSLSDELRSEFLDIKSRLERMKNVYIIDSKKWSFIEAIGISDIVVTQGMSSSATIAIICGILGLYLDEMRCNHPFAERFRDTLVFTEPEKLISMIHSVLRGEESPLKIIPEELLRHYDEYPDERGLEIYRDILSGRKKRVGIIIQARMGSTRLPGKVMLLVEGKSLLLHIFDRLKNCRMVDDIILATTVNKQDDVLADLAERNNLKLFRGSEEDVLSRYYYAAKENKLDVIVRITSDCPFVDPYMLDDMIERFIKPLGVDYLSNTLKRTFPRGLDIEIFNFSALEKAFNCAKYPYEREHVTSYLYEHSELFRIQGIENNCDLSNLRWTLDEEKDFEFIEEIYKRLYSKGKLFLTNDIIKVLADEPWLSEINTGVKQKVVLK